MLELSNRMHIFDNKNKAWISRMVEAAHKRDGTLLWGAGTLVVGFIGFFVGRKAVYNK